MRENNSLFEIKSAEKKEKKITLDLNQEWFSTEEAAYYLRIPTGSLRNMVCNGTIKASGKIGRLNRFHIDDLRELLARK